MNNIDRIAAAANITRGIINDLANDCTISIAQVDARIEDFFDDPAITITETDKFVIRRMIADAIAPQNDYLILTA